MEGVETQIAEWRAHVAKAPAVNGRDVDELEDHLRNQIDELSEAGLTSDEAFLVAVKRMGELDVVSREFAREHSGRLWKQLFEPEPSETALLAERLARRARPRDRGGGRDPGRAPGCRVPRRGSRPGSTRNARPARVALPRGVLRAPAAAATLAAWLLTAAPFVARGAGDQPLPLRHGLGHGDPGGAPPAGRAVVRGGLPYMGGTIRSHERRMDFVRFTGEWFIYYVLIALGGGVLMALTAGILQPTGVDVDRVAQWVMPSGAAGAVVVAAWLVESKQRVSRTWRPC